MNYSDTICAGDCNEGHGPCEQCATVGHDGLGLRTNRKFGPYLDNMPLTPWQYIRGIPMRLLIAALFIAFPAMALEVIVNLGNETMDKIDAK